MDSHMDKSLRYWLILVTLVVVAILATLWATSTTWFERSPFEPREWPPPMSFRDIRGDIELFYTLETVVSTINATLSIFLLLTYASIYQKTRSEFTLGLIIFSAVLLLHALVAIPLVQRAFGFYAVGLGPFAMLPDLFSLAALTVLLYLSIKY